MTTTMIIHKSTSKGTTATALYSVCISNTKYCCSDSTKQSLKLRIVLFHIVSCRTPVGYIRSTILVRYYYTDVTTDMINTNFLSHVAYSGKGNVTVWCPSVCPSVCLSRRRPSVYSSRLIGAACDVASIHFFSARQ